MLLRLPPRLLPASISLSDVVQALHLLLCPILFFIGLLYLIFADIRADQFITFGAIAITWLSIIGGVRIIERMVKFVHVTRETEELKQHQDKLLIGCFGSFVFSWLPRLGVYLVPVVYPFSSMLLWYLIFISLPTIGLFWITFIVPSKKHCKVVYQKKEHLPWTIIGVNVLLLLITVRLGMLYGWHVDRDTIMWTQIGFSLISLACMVEFGQVWKGKVVMLVGEETLDSFFAGFENPAVSLEDGQVEKVVIPIGTDSRLECKVCLDEYTDVKIPRMLKECGHSLCEGCADGLLNQTKGQHLFCPFCSKVTVVNGPAILLPKNFTICDMIDEKKKLEGK